MKNTERINRIISMESKFDEALKAINELEDAYRKFEEVIPLIEELASYYESSTWRSDFESDSNGELPKNLKRGVLSEDGIYNLLSDYERYKNNCL